MATSTTLRDRSFGPAAWLGALVAALVIALAIPGLAFGQEGATAVQDPPAAQADTPASEATPVAQEQPAPPAQETSPIEEPGPLAEAPPADETDPVDSPAPPPAEGPVATAPEQPALPELVPTVPELPVLPALPTLPEILPAIVAPPDAPRAKAPVVLSDVLVVPADPALRTAAPPIFSADTDAPGLAAAALGAPAIPASADPLAGLVSGPSGDVAIAPPAEARFSPVMSAFEPTRARMAPPATARPQGPGPASPGGEDAHPFAPSLGQVGGPLVGGSSLLAALVSYVLPGGGALPASTLFLFVSLAVLLAGLVAPRPGHCERLAPAARRALRPGHRLALARPG